MGFSTSGAAAIIFVGLLVATTIAFPALESAYDARASAMDDRDQRALDVRNTDIVVDPHADGDGDLVVNVTSTGSTTLSVDATDLLIDGDYYDVLGDDPSTTVEGAADRETYQPGETLTIETDATADDVERVKVVTEYGVAETVTEV